MYYVCMGIYKHSPINISDFLLNNYKVDKEQMNKWTGYGNWVQSWEVGRV